MQLLTTQSQLMLFFNDNVNAVKGNIVTRTPVKMNKKDVATKTIANPYGAIYKVQTISVELNAEYEMKVNTKRMLEGKEQDFEVEARKWGVHNNKSIIEKNGQLYLQVIEGDKIGKPLYETENGEPIEYDAFKAFVPTSNGSTKQGLDDEVKVRTFKLENVIGMFIPSMQVRYNPNK